MTIYLVVVLIDLKDIYFLIYLVVILINLRIIFYIRLYFNVKCKYFLIVDYSI